MTVELGQGLSYVGLRGAAAVGIFALGRGLGGNYYLGHQMADATDLLACAGEMPGYLNSELQPLPVVCDEGTLRQWHGLAQSTNSGWTSDGERPHHITLTDKPFDTFAEISSRADNHLEAVTAGQSGFETCAGLGALGLVGVGILAGKGIKHSWRRWRNGDPTVQKPGRPSGDLARVGTNQQ